jgi:hypothetical protein
MKRLLLLLAVAIAFSLTAMAQDTSMQGTETQSTTTTTKTTKAQQGQEANEAGQSGAVGTKGAPKEHSLTGCLAKSPEGNGYMLTNGHYKKGVMVNSSEDLSAHIGHEVKLTGTWEQPTAGEAGGAGAKGKEMRTFDATAVSHISDTCNMGKSKKGTEGAATPPPGL